MECKAALFDLDGTLLDTVDDLADSMNRVLREFGMPTHPVEPYKFFVGDGMGNLARRAAPAGTPDGTVEKMAERMAAVYGASWRGKTRPYDGIEDLVAELDKRGVPLAVLSNKPDAFTQAMVKHYFGEGRFARILGARPNAPRKPDPASALEIASALSVSPGAFLYLGDTNTDMRTGRAAGMFTVGVAWGFRPAAELEGAGAEAIIHKPAEALAFFGE